MAEYMNEVVVRCAPRWAWELIDNVLGQISEHGSAFAARKSGELAARAMSMACEVEIEALSPEYVAKFGDD